MRKKNGGMVQPFRDNKYSDERLGTSSVWRIFKGSIILGRCLRKVGIFLSIIEEDLYKEFISKMNFLISEVLNFLIYEQYHSVATL